MTRIGSGVDQLFAGFCEHFDAWGSRQACGGMSDSVGKRSIDSPHRLFLHESDVGEGCVDGDAWIGAEHSRQDRGVDSAEVGGELEVALVKIGE